jgi:hypothetical protein
MIYKNTIMPLEELSHHTMHAKKLRHDSPHRPHPRASKPLVILYHDCRHTDDVNFRTLIRFFFFLLTVESRCKSSFDTVALAPSCRS